MLAVLGWVLVALLGVHAWRLRRRLELVAEAEHELRGPLTAFGLALDSARGTPVGRRLAMVLDAELCRVRAALADLTAARTGRRGAGTSGPVDLGGLVRSSSASWGARVGSSGFAFVNGDRGRLAQVLGNVLSNAREHGTGEVSVQATRTERSVRIEVTNEPLPRPPAMTRGRGRGLRIAARAAREAGGSLKTAIDDERATAVIELPLDATCAESPPAELPLDLLAPARPHEPRRAA